MRDYKAYKKLLKNVYFVNGTAYAGKSTLVKKLADKYDMYHCKENYMFDDFLSKTSKESHPNMQYFNTMSSWEEFVSRSKEDYEKWMDGVSKETTPFELDALVDLASKHDKVIVDTNIPPEVLKEVSSYNRVLFMVATTDISVEYFFHRADPDKQFLLGVLNKMDRPLLAKKHFQDILVYVNRKERIDVFVHSGFLCLKRKKIKEDIDKKIALAERHFGLYEEK